jgi:hypothetical protein
MLRGSYTVQPPFKIISLDQNYWEQQLESVTLVQVNDIELELYTVNENTLAFNALATALNTDKTLSTILSDVSNANDQIGVVFLVLV